MNKNQNQPEPERLDQLEEAVAAWGEDLYRFALLRDRKSVV